MPIGKRKPATAKRRNKTSAASKLTKNTKRSPAKAKRRTPLKRARK